MFAELIRDVEAHPTRISLTNVAVCTEMLDKINNVPFRLTISSRKTYLGCCSESRPQGRLFQYRQRGVHLDFLEAKAEDLQAPTLEEYG